jgi:dihydropyrimidine dehydrogenase (NADP+)
MLHGYGMVKNLCGGLQQLMAQHDFKSVSEFKGKALPYFTTHSHLYEMQSEAIQARRKKREGLADDAAWTGDGFVKETESMVSNA